MVNATPLPAERSSAGGSRAANLLRERSIYLVGGISRRDPWGWAPVVTPAIVGLIYFMALCFAAAAADDWASLAGHSLVVTFIAVVGMAWVL